MQYTEMNRWLLLLLLPTALLASAQEAKLSADDVISKNLLSIGTPDARKSLQNLEFIGTGTLKSTRGNSVDGRITLLSDGAKLKWATKFNTQVYPDEQLVYDGKKVAVAQVRPGQRSTLGDFIWWQQVLLSDGLMGGELSTAWPLYDDRIRGAKLSFEGKKKVEGRELYMLLYHPKKSVGDLRIELYFDPANFQHVRTVYSIEAPPNFQPSSANQGDIFQKNVQQENRRFLLEEDFSDFRAMGNVTLPLHYTVHFSADSSAATENWIWSFDYKEVNGQKIPGT